LFADVNQNDSFEADERFSFEGSPREVVLKLPITGRYRYYPIRLFIPEHDLYMRDTSGKAAAISRTLARCPLAFVEGSVKIGGQTTLVRYMFDLAKDSAYADWGWQGMDTNGDGRIEETANSDEWTFASDENVIFRVNGHNVSTVSLDLASGTFVVREHPAGDNKRIRLHLGDSIPEFSFTDLAGKPHRFTEFRGRYVLLDFWGTWCGPCRAELPNLEKAYRQFRARNFIILGMNDEEESDQVRKVLSDASVTYPQSTGEAGKDLVHKRFRIDRFPTKALLDPQGKIIALDSDGSFDRQHLQSTLDKLLPPAKSSGEGNTDPPILPPSSNVLRPSKRLPDANHAG
jgi:thiol-disulfide isomerase/thioredoxin